MKVRLATIDDALFIKGFYKQHNKDLGDFNLFYVWDDFLAKKARHKYVVIDDCGFMRYGYSKKYKAFVLYEIAVEDKKKGVGRTFFNHLPRPLMLKCNQSNDAGNKFYEAMGMTKAGVTQTSQGVKQNIWWIT